MPLQPTTNWGDSAAERVNLPRFTSKNPQQITFLRSADEPPVGLVTVLERTATIRLVGRVIPFVLVFAVLQIGWQSVRDTFVEHVVIHDGIVVPATTVVN